MANHIEGGPPRSQSEKWAIEFLSTSVISGQSPVLFRFLIEDKFVTDSSRYLRTGRVESLR